MSDANVYGVLRASFARCFEMLARDAIDATQMQLVLEELTRVSRSILSGLVDDWHLANDPLRRLPNELIAQCFASLPLRDRIRASHVCRGWRSIALAHPVVWADLDFRERFFDKESLLEMALERAAQHPVVIRSCPEPTRPAGVVRVLTAHMSHIQYLELPDRVSVAVLSQPAPHLRYLQLQTDCRIRPEFLGGCVGQLRTLKLRSATFDACPALSTVTDLTLNPPFNPDQHDAYRPLFSLFPALRSLTLPELASQDKRLVPDGPAPASLRHLSLKTSQFQFDVCECFAHWESVAPNLSHVAIEQFSLPGRHLRRIVSGAVELIVLQKCFGMTWEMDILAVGPRERRREVTFWSPSDDSELVAQTLVDLRSVLEDVTSLNVSATSLAAFLPVLAVLPRLAHLTATFTVHTTSLDPHNPLSYLARVPEHCPRLQSIAITVVSGNRQCPPFADDARILLSQLESIAHVQLPDLVIMGFSEDVASGIRVPPFDGFHIAFGHGDGMAKSVIADPAHNSLPSNLGSCIPV
ncbi:hypothetical protein AURDEDRAFT_128103 [Auricularia subglabra TFB-10046 SS5]|uniref:F-box domain-containing protein n=1 Tax=Auricularia subglabra (strain TFB-10046 / SS5) TaxID=717982 RepID=J0WXQ8_AURST|nr:hypothetical protein AURDEDRAFT_128103 [Auricularia subglabra TFB-10046 SS5]